MTINEQSTMRLTTMESAGVEAWDYLGTRAESAGVEDYRDYLCTRAESACVEDYRDYLGTRA